MSATSFLKRPLRFNTANYVLYIIGLNGILFLFSTISPQLRGVLSLIPAQIIANNRWWQLITYMFMHANFYHLLFNMLGLYFFGTQVERTIGSNEFLLFYLVCGVGAGAVSLIGYLLSGQVNVYLLGASGAVYAVLLAFATYYPTARIFIFGIIPMRAPVLVIAFTVIAVFSGVLGRRGNVAHLTHLAGFIFAYFYLVIRLNINPIKVFLNNR